MPTAAPDFRIFWDNAYCVHDLYDRDRRSSPTSSIFARAAAPGFAVVAFASTSRSPSGAGIGFIGCEARGHRRVLQTPEAGLISADKSTNCATCASFPSRGGQGHMEKACRVFAPAL